MLPVGRWSLHATPHFLSALVTIGHASRMYFSRYRGNKVANDDLCVRVCVRACVYPDVWRKLAFVNRSVAFSGLTRQSFHGPRSICQETQRSPWSFALRFLKGAYSRGLRWKVVRGAFRDSRQGFRNYFPPGAVHLFDRIFSRWLVCLKRGDFSRSIQSEHHNMNLGAAR